ncbi:MAG TPA: hypothetical protein VH309_03380 [Elusimicrobiota bacterium]|nr:hypothetical protein [Elusimicrobiota bacterium]
MRRIAGGLGAAALVAALAAGSAAAPKPAASAARFVAKAEAALDSLEAGAGGNSEAVRECQARFTMKGLMSHLADPAWREPAMPMQNMLEMDALDYYQCVAYFGKGPAACSPMKVFNEWIRAGDGTGHLHGIDACSDHYYDLMLHARSFIMHKVRVLDACHEYLKHARLKKPMSPQDADEYCSLVDRYQDQPELMCSKTVELRRKRGDNMKFEKCVPFQRGVEGDEKACAELPADSHIKERCYAYAAFRNAYQARDARLCKGQFLCETLMSPDASICAVGAGHLRDMVCSPYMLVVRRQSEIKALLDKASSELANEGARASSSTRSRIERARRRYDLLVAARDRQGGAR